MAEKLNIFIINIYGVSGSGKTNLALYLAEVLHGIYNEYVLITPKTVQYMKEELSRLRKNTLLIIEDFTYLAGKHNTVTDQFLRELMLVRHSLEHAAIIIISHYTTSILPALRLSHVRALTSLTTYGEINKLKELFNLGALHDYYELYTNTPTQYYTLLNILGKHTIIKTPLTHTYTTLKKTGKLEQPFVELTPHINTVIPYITKKPKSL